MDKGKIIAGNNGSDKDGNNQDGDRVKRDLVSNAFEIREIEIRQKREATCRSYDTSQRFKAGACTNCGGLNHNAKNCLDKPYAVGANYRKLIYPDEQETAKKKENVEPYKRRFVPTSRNENGLKISADYVDKSLKTVFINPRDRQDIPHYLKKQDAQAEKERQGEKRKAPAAKEVEEDDTLDLEQGLAQYNFGSAPADSSKTTETSKAISLDAAEKRRAARTEKSGDVFAAKSRPQRVNRRAMTYVLSDPESESRNESEFDDIEDNEDDE